MYYILYITAVHFQPPISLYIIQIDLREKEVTFNWDPVAPIDCPGIHYNILASNCGSCPTNTAHTTVTCTDVPMDGSLCIFALQTAVYRYSIGNISKSIEIQLKGDHQCVLQ